VRLRITKRYIIAIAAIVAVTAVSAVWAQAWRPVQPGSSAVYEFTVQPGWGGSRIAGELHRAGLVRSVFAFIIYTNLTDTGDHLQAGTYELSPGMTPDVIAGLMAEGRALSTDITVTVPEGSNIWQIDDILWRAGIIDARGIFSEKYHFMEGYLFPETYRFAENADARDVYVRMHEPLLAYTQSQVIVASILEKEAKIPDDMALVAGIINRRLALAMPLQVDATVAYGWCVRMAGFSRSCDVTQAPIATEVSVDGPYNTYARTGLPVGPISNPGLAALEAAAHPKDSPYLYYLSTRDGSQLIYAKTLGEHLANCRKYLGL
jgi:UPF0755 protein